MKNITITENDLMKILCLYDEDRFMAENLNALSFCDFIFNKYQPERSKREDECKEIGHMYTWMPQDQSLCMRCGALSSMET